MSFARQTTYGQIAEEPRRAILAGEDEPTSDQPDRNQLPGAAELGAKYGVSNKTTARAVQQLVSEGLVQSRSGMRPMVVPRAQRLDRWPMTGRYARARETLIGGRAAELSRSDFPPAIAEGTPLTVADDLPPGGVVRVLEDQGQRIMRSCNEARARIATEEELRAFDADRDRSPLVSRIVIEVTHDQLATQPRQVPPPAAREPR